MNFLIAAAEKTSTSDDIVAVAFGITFCILCIMIAMAGGK